MVKQVVVYDTETGEISQAVVDAFKAANLTAVSTDEGNTATLGSDNLIFVPAAEGGTAPEGTMVWRGAWEGATAYAVNDVVLYDSVAWVATEASTGSTPTSGKQAPMPPTDLAADAPLVHIATGDAYWAITYYHDQTAYTDDGSGMRSGAWWKITPVESGTLTVTESGLSFQNLSIWKFVEGILTRQAGDSENSVSLAVTAGVTYYILTASAIPQTGNLTITISGVLSYAPTWTPLSGDLAAYYTAAEADALLAGKAPAPTGTPDGTKYLRDDNTWAEVASGIPASEDWITPTLLNGWTGDTVGYYKDPLGIVRLKGVVVPGTGVIFALPAGYRPRTDGASNYPTNSGGGFGVIAIAGTTGNVTRLAGGGAYVFLDGIAFRAEA